MDEQSLQVINPSDLAAKTGIFVSYLEQFGLPTDNIIASTDERGVIYSNLPIFLSALSTETKKDARYLSKFIGATAIGLFDAALNYVWNEVVLNLRKKASIYGIDLFFDAAVGGKNRELYKDAIDLGGLKDSVLLDTCLKLELISDIVYRKLANILTMRNELAASHPNVESIGGFELLGWLQTCIKDVLQDPLSESAIKIGALVNNLKSRTSVIDEITLDSLKAELKYLSSAHVHNLLITIFGIFIAPESNQVLRKNISSIAPLVWNCTNNQIKYKIGIQIDGYRTNLHQEKLERGVEFLTIVNGQMYENLSARIIALENLADQLEDVHEGLNNFYNEPAIIQEILNYCRTSTDIPKEALPRLVKIVLRCRLGNGVSYRDGVSPGGLALYDQFLKLLDDDGIAECIRSLFHPEVNSKLRIRLCQVHLKIILQNLRTIAISERLRDSLDFLIENVSEAYSAKTRKDFLELTASFL